MRKIRAVFVGFEFIVTVVFVIFLMFLFRKKNRALRHSWANLQKKLIGFDVNIKGTPDNSAQLLIINHQSILDIVALEAVYPKERDIAWAAKKEIFDLFLLGQAVKLTKMICVDRGDKRALVQLVKDAKERLSHDRPIAIFPEGTRGRGEKLLKFQLGAKILAEKLDLKVQPVVIANARYLFDSQNFSVNKGTMDISYLEPFTLNTDDKWYEKLREQMQAELTALLSARQS